MKKIHLSFVAVFTLLLATGTANAQNTKANAGGNKASATVNTPGTILLTDAQNPEHKIRVAVENIKPASGDVSGIYNTAFDDNGNIYAVSLDGSKVYKAPAATAATINALIHAQRPTAQ